MSDAHTPRRTWVHKPYPELVEPTHPVGPWRVVDSRVVPLPSNGAVDPVERWLAVPLESGGRWVARHELAHVRWSPVRLPRVRFDARVLAVVEDARINLALAQVGLPMEPDREGRARVCMLAARDAKQGDVFALVARVVASLGTGVEEPLREQLRELGRLGRFVNERADRVAAELARARERAGREIAPFRDGLRIARRLARELRAASVLDASGCAHSAAPGGCCVVRAELAPEDPSRRLRAGRRPATGTEPVEPGRMHIVRAPLSVKLRAGRTPGRGWRAAAEGSHVRYLDRWLANRTIFGRRRRGRGAFTVLVDTSGSMSLRESDLDALLAATPSGALVAMYSGRGGEGELRIVADGGRRTTLEHLAPFGGGNVVDVPALQWLLRRPAPRVWISDMGVTGVGDRHSPALVDAAEALRRRGRVTRAPTIDDAVAWMRALSRGSSR